jgi:hypothetical protein
MNMDEELLAIRRRIQTALGPTQTPIQQVPEILSLVVKGRSEKLNSYFHLAQK